MSFEIRPLKQEHVPAFRQAIMEGFGNDPDPDDQAAIDRFKAVFETDRMYPAYDGDEIVGTGGDFEFQVTVPGGAQVPMSGLTIITVKATHTRQGVLTAMMRTHLNMAHERGEPLGGLWASEVPIYGRFGYGQAILMRGIKYDARFAGRGGSEPDVTVRLVKADEAEVVLPRLYATVQAGRPGMLQRTETWWKNRLFLDLERYRDGGSALRHVVAERDGEPIGYLTYRQKAEWDTIAGGEIRVREIIPVDDAAYRALWHYASNVDLFPIVKYWNNPVDDALPLIFNDGRAIATTDYSDGVWVRLIDVADALTRRAYQTDGVINIGISDRFCPWNEGTFQLSVSDGIAACDKTSSEADVTMDVSTLGALYMGGRDATAFSRAGRISGDAAAIDRLSVLFRVPRSPWCAEIF